MTPKSKNQMIFLTYMIPFVCGSFAVYTNCMVEVYTDTFLKEDESRLTEEKEKIE